MNLVKAARNERWRTTRVAGGQSNNNISTIAEVDEANLKEMGIELKEIEMEMTGNGNGNHHNDGEKIENGLMEVECLQPSIQKRAIPPSEFSRFIVLTKRCYIQYFRDWVRHFFFNLQFNENEK